MPYGVKWMHVGHTITIDPSVENSKTGLSEVISQKSKAAVQRQDIGVADGSKSSVLAYRFDEKRVQPSSWIGPGGNVLSKMIYGGQDRKIMEYVHTLEKFTHLGLPWVSKFVGEEGEGVRSGKGDEMRTVV
mmetsp:Transcript_16904/g.38026  ORF Transcript_16904/g.38026 Transcript_16904/m.38026 type:complete len:131 (-) Transcript_16904:177-569(-)